MTHLPTRTTYVLATLGAFALGAFAASAFHPTTARASSLAGTVIVPHDGLTFRTPEGHVLARLSEGSTGGVFELYDASEHPSAVVRAGAIAPAKTVSAWAPGTIDGTLVDPWAAVTPPQFEHVPGSGL